MEGHAGSQLPVLPEAAPRLVLERGEFLEGDAPAADQVQAFLARALEASDGSATVIGALPPWTPLIWIRANGDQLCDNARRVNVDREPPRAAG
jgi:hypothetical protein